MIIVQHRRNTIAQLQETPTEFGVELDIRSHGDALIVQHDPFMAGERLSDWLAHYRHRLLILNVKEEGLEERLLDLMREYAIGDYFFLDQSFPFLLRTANRGEPRCAVRVSEYESIDTALALAGKVEWVWVDCFTRFPLRHAQAEHLRQAGFKLCVVSPELQGRIAPGEIRALQSLLQQERISIDAVCTKEAALWQGM